MRPEDQRADELAALDEALASGRVVEPADVEGLGPVGAVLWLLEQAYPRSTGASVVHQTSAEPDSRAAETFGRYRILTRLGGGSFGIVFLAWDPTLRRHVALKLPQPAVLLTPEARQRFVREAQAAGALDHPNIVAVHDAGLVGSVAYLTLTYCPGITLGEWLARQVAPVPIEHAVALVATLAEAVQHAHDRGILHRDLKPSNVLLTVIEPTDSPESPATTNADAIS